MTRKIKIGITQCEVSKNEAKEAQTIADITRFSPDGTSAQHRFNQWIASSPTPEARARRLNVGKALGLNVPDA
jgi:hypothetical protein